MKYEVLSCTILSASRESPGINSDMSFYTEIRLFNLVSILIYLLLKMLISSYTDYHF